MNPAGAYALHLPAVACGFGATRRLRGAIPTVRGFAPGGRIHSFGAEQLVAAGLAKLHAVSPIFAVHRGMAPFLCIHGTKDDQVPHEQSPAMCDAMKKVGAGCELITIEGGGHGMSGWRAPELQHWKPEMLAWLNKTMN